MRVMIDGEVAGYHLWFEQPNGTFFRRHNIDDKGNLYKLIWMGSHRPTKYTPKDKIPDRMDIVGKHEKKTNPHDGYEDIVSLIETLEAARGDDAKMWQVIQEQFDVDQVINYFAVNALLTGTVSSTITFSIMTPMTRRNGPSILGIKTPLGPSAWAAHGS
jgi:spore coat protein CotH